MPTFLRGRGGVGQDSCPKTSARAVGAAASTSSQARPASFPESASSKTARENRHFVFDFKPRSRDDEADRASLASESLGSEPHPSLPSRDDLLEDVHSPALLLELLFTWKQSIAELKVTVLETLDDMDVPKFVDNVFLLRYILSFKADIGKAATAACSAIRWRVENAALIEAAKTRSKPEGLTHEDIAEIGKHLAVVFGEPTVHKDPVCIIKVADCNIQKVMDFLGEEKMMIWLAYSTQCVWHYCDTTSRQLGYFVKQITLIDLDHPPFSGAANRDKRYFQASGRNSKMNEWLCPQMSDRIIFFNAPTWAKVLWKTASPFLSKRTIEKISVHKKAVGGSADVSRCPFAENMFERGSVPTFLGGTLECQLVEDHLTNMYNRQFGGDDAIALRRMPFVPETARGSSCASSVATPHESFEPGGTMSASFEDDSVFHLHGISASMQPGSRAAALAKRLRGESSSESTTTTPSVIDDSNACNATSSIQISERQTCRGCCWRNRSQLANLE